MLQKQYKLESGKKVLDCEGLGCERHEPAKPAPAAESTLYRWGASSEEEHPRSIGKSAPHPRIQEYEANIPYLNAMVLNIYGKISNGDGGLLLALEVRAPCGGDNWIEVDRARCSSRYPCTLRIPSGAVRVKDEPIKFRTAIVEEEEDYWTDFLEYERVTLDHDAEVVVTHESWDHNAEDKGETKILRFSLNAVLASGALTVTPVIRNGNEDAKVSIKIRQPEPRNDASLEQQGATGDMGLQALEATLQSYRDDWAAEWRTSSKDIGACDCAMFEVVADQLYPGEVELEVAISDANGAELSDVIVTSRLTWSEAEVQFLDTILKDHFGFFNDPEVIIHGLPLDAYKKENPKQLTDSNPCEWGYAMESWIIMAETGALKPDEAVAKLSGTFETLQKLQSDSSQFAHGLFYPYYRLRDKDSGEKLFPQRTEYAELPCGDDALLFASMLMVQGWLTMNNFHEEAKTCGQIVGKMDFSHCIRMTDCNAEGNGLKANDNAENEEDGDRFWSVPLTFNADTLKQNSFNWNVWADEGGLVSMILALTDAVSHEQYESIVHQQQRYSPCARWEGVTVGHAAFFNSIFTLPTRSMLGFGTLFSSPYYHEFAVRSVLPTFRAHQKLKKQLKVDYMGPSDAMSMMPKNHVGKFFGSYAYWPPNNMYDCRKGRSTKENQCTWCKNVQYEGLDDPFDLVVPHGNMASFLMSAMMEKSQFQAWIEDTKLLVTDWAEIYHPGYGLEVMAPARRTERGKFFDGAYDGRGVWESLSHGYTVLSMYEGLATMRRRFELAKQAGLHIPGSYEPPNYKPLSDFLTVLPDMRSKINKLLATAWEQKSKERKCEPSDFGPPGKY